MLIMIGVDCKANIVSLLAPYVASAEMLGAYIAPTTDFAARNIIIWLLPKRKQ